MPGGAARMRRWTSARRRGASSRPCRSAITGISVAAGAFSGERLGGPLGDALQDWGIKDQTAHTVGFTIVIVLTTYVSLIIGSWSPSNMRCAIPSRSPS